MSSTREELRKKLHSKLLTKKMGRISKEKKEHMISKSLKKMGIDKDKFKKDLEDLKKQGGFTKEQQEQIQRLGSGMKEPGMKEPGIQESGSFISNKQKEMLKNMGITSEMLKN